MKEWWEREITRRDDVAALARNLTTGRYEGTDLQKVGFVFFGTIVALKVA